MKRLNYLMNALAVCTMMILFTQCANKADNQAANTSAQVGELSGIKVAYVDVDSILNKYNFCIDMNEAIAKKIENMRVTLNKEAQKLEKEKQEFQTKVQYNAFTQDRAESEYRRIAKMEQDLQAMSNKLTLEMENEQAQNSLALRDSINSFLKEYNKDKGYDFIFSNSGFDNLLFANKGYNITEEVVSGLNARYSAATSK